MRNSPLGYRSLYWRIGLGFILCVAVVLAIQSVVLLWMLSRADRDQRTAFTLPVSLALGTALEQNRTLDIDRFIADRFPDAPDSFYVVMKTGQVFYFGQRHPTSGAIAAVLDEFQHRDRETIPLFWERTPFWASPIYINGVLAGTVSMVAVDSVERWWRPMTVLAACLLVVGTVLASRFIFGPAHRRLIHLETTARKLGAGEVTARADEEGGDEVASLARTFNAMATDLVSRSEQIAEFDRARRLLLADISHELMTPLTAIRACQERLAADSALSLTAERRRYLTILDEESQRVERIVRDLLDLARFENRRDSLDMQDASIEELFGRVAARHGVDAATRSVQLTTTIEPGAEIVRGDQFRLEQALQNLAANALRYVRAGGSIALQARLMGAELILLVRDTGAGIPPEHLPHIFDRFYKVDSSRAAGTEGSGLGLSIVKAIIERHGGTIEVSSTPFVETVFTIHLPARAETTALSRSA
jgi:signal transduction histidine kinase